MSTPFRMRWLASWLFGALVFAGCAADTSSTGDLRIELELAEGIDIDEVTYAIGGNGMDPPMVGTINTSAPGSTASVEVYGIPAGDNYEIVMNAVSADGETSCSGSAQFDVAVGVVTEVAVMLNCKPAQELGGVRVNGEFNFCADITFAAASPLTQSLGNQIDLRVVAEDRELDRIEYRWTATGGSIADPAAPETTYTCLQLGPQTITITVSDDGFDWCDCDYTFDEITCVDGTGGSGGMGGAAGAGGAGGMAGGGGAGGMAGAGGTGGTGGTGGVAGTFNTPEGSILVANGGDVLDCDDADPGNFPGNDESCDGLDNDCDGITDDEEDMPNVGLDDPLCLDGLGICDNAYFRCVSNGVGGWTVGCCSGVDINDECIPPQSPQTETCNSLDDDCDGETDETFSPTGPCGGAPGPDPDEGACQEGSYICDGSDVVCSGNIDPVAEPDICNGIDENCNGSVDELIYEPCGGGPGPATGTVPI